jgi:hypothetical protein
VRSTPLDMLSTLQLCLLRRSGLARNMENRSIAEQPEINRIFQKMFYLPRQR